MKITVLTSLMVMLLGLHEISAQKLRHDYNRWSVDGGLGIASSYEKGSGYDFYGLNAGLRYNLSRSLAMKFGVESGALEYADKMHYVDFAVLMPVNIIKLTGAEYSVRNVNFFITPGIGVHQHSAGDIRSSVSSVGKLNATLSYRINNRMAVNMSYLNSLVFNESGEDVAASAIPDNLSYNSITAGVSIYFGSEKQHADWAPDPELQLIKKNYSYLSTRIKNTAETLTAQISTVDSRVNEQSAEIDELKRQIQALETKVNNETMKPEEVELSNEGVSSFLKSMSVMFPSNSVKPYPASLPNILAIADYLKENPEKSLDINGYTDKIGDKSENSSLSSKRAMVVYYLLVDLGVESYRLKASGKGNGANGASSDELALQTNRIVEFSIATPRPEARVWEIDRLTGQAQQKTFEQPINRYAEAKTNKKAGVSSSSHADFKNTQVAEDLENNRSVFRQPMSEKEYRKRNSEKFSF
ncbi:MAG: OmpA family protein [Bacteroidales bacterium]